MGRLMHLGRIHIFPIKALDGVTVEETRITPGGILEQDRVYAMVDAEGKILNGKRTPRVHELRCEFDAAIKEVCFRPNEGEAIQFPLDEPRRLGQWLSGFFGFEVSLRQDLQNGFADDRKASGPTITSEASLLALQHWFPELTLAGVRRRFRANLELAGGEAFCEDSLFGPPDTLKPFQIGDVKFVGHNPCQRCIVPTRDPETAEPLVDFRDKFARLRRESLPAWAEAQRFNHFYRFAVNTSIPASESGKRLISGGALVIGS
jgi:uncharacterized protein YcbX